MFYDPTCKLVSRDPKCFDLRSFVDWLERQPPEGAYDYRDGDTCVAAQYHLAMFGSLETYNYRLQDVSPDLWRVAVGSPSPEGMRAEWTFGAALARARKLLAGAPVHVS